MSSNPASGTSTPNPRFTTQTKTAEDILKNQTVGLVALSDYRKRRAEAIEQKERDAQDAILGGEGGSGRGTPGTVTPDGASTPKERAAVVKKKKRKIGTAKLSFGIDDEEDGGDSTDAVTPMDTPANSRAGTPGAKVGKKGANALVAAPKALTKAAVLKDAQTREVLRKEFLVMQEAIKETEISIPFVFYDGTNIPGGVCRIKKGDFVWVFLDKSRKVGAELGVGEKINSRREWARIGVDDLLMVRGSIIIPHHYDFYYFIVNNSLGPKNQILFDYSSDLDNGRKLDIEGMNDDPTFTKVVDRRWYERNKHIFPASVWQEFDPEKDYQTEIKRDAGGNAFFFS